MAVSTNGSAWLKKERDPLSIVSYMDFSGQELRIRFRAEVKDLLRGRFKLGLTNTPKHLDLMAAGPVKSGIAQELMMPCIYELKDGVLTFGVGLSHARPTKLEPSNEVELSRFERVTQDPLTEPLEGEWELVSREEGGKAFKAEKGSTIVSVYEDGLLCKYVNGKSLSSAQYTVAKRNGVHEIDFTDELSIFEKKSQTFLGIYSITDNTLQICLANSVGAPRPTSFTTSPASDSRIKNLKRRNTTISQKRSHNDHPVLFTTGMVGQWEGEQSLQF